MMTVCRFALVVQAVKAKAVVATSACLHLCIVLLRSLSLLNIVKYVILTNTPDRAKTDCEYSRLLGNSNEEGIRWNLMEIVGVGYLVLVGCYS